MHSTTAVEFHTSTLFVSNFDITLPGDLEHLRVVKQERHARFAHEHGMSRYITIAFPQCFLN